MLSDADCNNALGGAVKEQNHAHLNAGTLLFAFYHGAHGLVVAAHQLVRPVHKIQEDMTQQVSLHSVVDAL